MIKLYIFESIREAAEFQANSENRTVTITGSVGERSVAAESENKPELSEIEAHPERKKYTKHAPKKNPRTKMVGVGKGGGKMHCKICGELGRSDAHPNHGKKKADDLVESKAMNPDELREAVRGLQEDGLDSLRVAQKLRIRISEVNKYWDQDLALSMGKKDEDEEEEEEI